ncbi:MAG TPA: DEAD/DEAH box helicase [Gammaproteobacteria bacterium]|nr:DEAD/DEAH box helicase [Gammaproteobacteria bacterium]
MSNSDATSSWSLQLRPRTWQKEALDLWIRNGYCGVASVVTGGGKTTFALMCMVKFCERIEGARFLIVVPTLTLLDQWYVSLVDDLGVSPDSISCFSGEEHPDSLTIINIAVINTARHLKHVPQDEERTLLIVDECHRAGSPVNARAMEGSFAGTLGLSATPVREYDEGFQQYVEPALGKIIYAYDYRDAFRDGVICPFELVNVEVSLLPDEDAEYRKLTGSAVRVQKQIEKGEPLQDRLKNILISRARLASSATMRIPVAAKLVDSLRGSRIIVFHERVDAAEKIFEILKSRQHRATLYHSGISPPVRRDNLRLFRRGIFDVLVSCRALDEGMNVPETQIAIIASASGSSRQRIQRLGRVLRPAPGKDHAIIYTVFATNAERGRLKREEERLQDTATSKWLKVDLLADGQAAH